ncbi:MAG: c-type cytochrome [candidate division WOR-3 bacterium]
MMWILFLLFIFSCNKKEEKVLTYQEVKALFKERGCTNCHDMRRNLVGPPFVSIAQRYKNNKDAEKILFKSLKDGSCNKWVNDCMPKQNLNKKEAKAMIRWILNLEP